MPIYAYKCSSCGHTQDVMQKISDAPLNVCTACGAETFAKQITAAGFQLKGNGWYATDFKNGSGKKGGETGKSETGKSETGKSETGKSEAGKGESPATAAKPAEAASGHACGSGACSACS
jgi:putative FmdB family regulatory protein